MTKLTKKLGKLWEDKTGVSPIIAVILMVAITVVLAATIYVWVSGFGGGEGTTASLGVNQVDYDFDGDTNYTLEYRIMDAEGGLGWEDIEINLAGDEIWDGETGTNLTIYRGGGATTITEGKIEAGDTFVYTTVTDPLGYTLNIFDIDGDNILWSADVHY